MARHQEVILTAPAVVPPAPAAPQVAVRRIPGLDGLRAISILLVLLAHASGTRGFPGTWSYLGRLGNLGVRIFFVISGYLITTLLLRELAQTGTIRLLRFSWRRALRLFPAAFTYISVIAAGAAIKLVQLMPGDLIAALTYTMNFHFHRAWPLGHLWSLAVEEQFYLLWPAALLLARRQRAVFVLAAVCVLSPVLRVLLWAVSPRLSVESDQMFFTVADTLATGCLLAVMRESLWKRLWYRRVILSRWFWVVAIAPVVIHGMPWVMAQWIIGQTLMNACIALLIDRAMRVTDDAFGRFLGQRPVAALGVMSYSLYLWQQPFLDPSGEHLVNAFPLNVLLAGVLAWVSYNAIERPALRWRDAQSKHA